MTELQRLRDRVEQLEEVLGVNPSIKDRLYLAFGLEPQLAAILGMLYKREFVTRSGLYTVLYEGSPEADWPQEKSLDVRMHYLRNALKDYGITIITRWKCGWFMRPEDKAKVREALDRIQQACDAAQRADICTRRMAFLNGA